MLNENGTKRRATGLGGGVLPAKRVTKDELADLCATLRCEVHGHMNVAYR